MVHTDDIVIRSADLVRAGHVDQAVELLDSVPESDRDSALWSALGDALQAGGDYRTALAAYERVDPGAEDDTTRTRLQIGRSTCHWRLGHAEPSVDLARAAVDGARALGDPQLRACAHVALALAVSLGGDPATVEEHYARAATLALEAGDLVLAARTEINRSHHLLADARFNEAVEVAASAGAAADELGSPALLAVALGNEGEGLIRLGRHAEATERFHRQLGLARCLGSARTAGALVGLAQVHLRQGSREQARAALEQALRLAPAGTDRQVRVPALAALAEAWLPEDVAKASAFAEEALAAAQGSAQVAALVAAGWTASAREDVETAREMAATAVGCARRRRERTQLAQALELSAAVGPETAAGTKAATAALREAAQIWAEAHATHDADRVTIRLARLGSTSETVRLAARMAQGRLDAAGVSVSSAGGPSSPGPQVQIRVFGRFDVTIDGVLTGAEAWQSRQARQLLRLLVSRRGRAISRLQVCELLWPDDDPDRTAHRLSVLLTIVRGVVGAEAIVTDQTCVALAADRVSVDVEVFLADVDDGLALLRHGSDRDAEELLAAAVRSYTDDPFADAPDDDWVAALRDEARAAYVRSSRVLADLRRRAGDHDEAAAYLRRILTVDRYDEAAHRSLLAVLNRAGPTGSPGRRRPATGPRWPISAYPSRCEGNSDGSGAGSGRAGTRPELTRFTPRCRPR